MHDIITNRTAGTSAMRLVLLLAATVCAVAGEEEPPAAPGSYRILAEDGVIRFPFDIYHGDIRFRGEVNGHKVQLLLDDGFMWDPLLFWGGAEVDSLDLEYEVEAEVGEPKDERSIPSRTASGITVRFPGVEFSGQTAVVTASGSGVSKMWEGSVGQISATFFKHFVVDIDFDEMKITLIEPGKFEYGGQGNAIPWTPMGFGPWSIPATLNLAGNRSVSLDLMMDLGYNDQLQIRTAGDHAIPVPERVLPAGLGFNIQGEETRGFLGRVPSVRIGGYEVRDVLSAFVSKEHSANTFSEVMIGLGLLSRFNLVFDFSRQRLYVEPNRRSAEPFEHDMSGMVLEGGEKNYLTVARVFDDSPARDAGIREGDRITSINGKPAAEVGFWDLRALMRRKGETVMLIVERGSENLQVAIKLRRVI